MKEIDIENGKRFLAAAQQAIDHPDEKQERQLKKKNGAAEFKCPICGGRAFVQRSSYNGHARGYCQVCGVRFME